MLEGIRVLDLSRVIAGPYAATFMADLGADVVKVERPGRGDELRHWRGGGMSAVYAAINRGKRCAAIDLQHPEGARAGFALARRADVVTLVQSFDPGLAVLEIEVFELGSNEKGIAEVLGLLQISL